MRFILFSFVFVWLLVSASSCKHPAQRSLAAQMSIESLKAQNIEETLSGEDEVLLTYSMTIYNKNDKMFSVVNGTWGITEMKNGSSYAPQSFTPIEAVVPPGGRVVMALALTEIDDYDIAKQTVNKLKAVSNSIHFPDAVELLLPEVGTAIKVIKTSFSVAGIAVDVVSFLDNDDLLGQDLHQVSQEAIQKGNRSFKVPLVFKGSNWGDKYEYTLDYSLKLQELYAKKKKKKD